MKAVFLNAGKLDFDKKLDFSSIKQITTLTNYDDSSDAEIFERVQGQDIVLTKELPVSGEIIAQFPPSVKLICEAGTGYNNIDIAAARAKNIAVCNIPTYSTEAVAQLAITFILNLSASLPQQQHMLERKDFSNFTDYLKVPHFEVQGKTLGVIGAGAIGRHTIKLALALGMQVLVFDPYAKAFDDANVKIAGIEEVLKSSDFITLHCPLTPDTRHIINADRLKIMKPTAFIINTSRGPLIKEEDLIPALKNGQIAGAALDVQDPEPPSTDNPLFYMDNVIMTPHIGWRRYESRQRLVNLMADNIRAFIDGKPINVVNAKK